MDPKSYVFAAAIIGLIVNAVIPDKPKPAPAASTLPADVTAASIANLGAGPTAPKRCVPDRVGDISGIILQWNCDGSVLGPKDQAEINKIDGAEGASEINFVPGIEFGKDVLVPHVTRGGPLPNLDPIPEPDPKPVEVEKPVEGLGAACWAE